MDPISARAIAAWILVHVGALAAAWGTRVAAGSRLESLFQIAFFVAMLCVGAVACMSCQLQLGFSVPSGVTLVLMVLAAVVDFRPTLEPVGRMHS
jgi:hypothetical protein